MRIKGKGMLGIFTLIELLVVIAIIAILAGLLLQSLMSARGRARSMSCMANMKHISTACQLYQNENDSWFMPARVGSSTDWATYFVNGQSWVDYLVNEKIFSDYRLFSCPASAAPKPETMTVNKGEYSHYGVNFFHIGTSKRYSDVTQPAKMSSIQNFSSVVMLTEDRSSDNTRSSYMVTDDPAETTIDGLPLGLAYPVHSNKSFNVLWCDGHASNEQSKTTTEAYGIKGLGTKNNQESKWRRQ